MRPTEVWMTPKYPTFSRSGPNSPKRPVSTSPVAPDDPREGAGGSKSVQPHHNSLQTGADFDRLFDLLGEQCRMIDQLCDLGGQVPEIDREKESGSHAIEQWLERRREMIGVITELEGRLAADWPGWEKLEELRNAEFCGRLDQMLQQRRTQLDRLNEADDLLRRQIEVHHRQIKADLTLINQGGRALGAYRQNGRAERPDARFTDQEI